MISSVNISSDGSVFGKPDPAVIQETRERQTLFNTKMISYRVRHGRPEITINFRTKHHMPTVYMTAGTFPGLANVEVMTPSFVVVSTPYRQDADVERFRRHFQDIFQLTQFS
jgi:hypothetical protein